MVGLSRSMGLAALCVPALATAQITMPKGVTPVSLNLYDLHIMVIWIVIGIMAVVYGVIIYSVIRHRKSKGDGLHLSSKYVSRNILDRNSSDHYHSDRSSIHSYPH
jgi:heme/copper-type cytochrome/quinol oxidase subunit 2